MKSKEIINEIMQFCKTHNFEYESSKDLLQLQLENLVEQSKVEQMHKVHEKMGIK